MCDTFASLKQKPLELHEDDEAIGPFKAIHHVEKGRGTIIEHFRKLRPKAFRNDPQITDEATTAFIRQILRTVQEIKVPGFEYFEPVESLVLHWNGMRRLEFTNTQIRYATSSDHDISSSRSTLTMHDIITRCPNLEVLVFRISPAFMLRPLTPTSVTNQVRNSTPCTHLLRILEHPRIHRLELQCVEGGKASTGFSIHSPPSTKEFKPFVETFRNAAEAAERQIEMEVDFSPGIVKNPKNPQVQRRHEDGFTWIEYHDWFG